jgi:hypothetical protein
VLENDEKELPQIPVSSAPRMAFFAADEPATNRPTAGAAAEAGVGCPAMAEPVANTAAIAAAIFVLRIMNINS